MPIVQSGSINTTALIVPDLYVQIVPPQNLVLNGVPSNIVGVVGTAQWGPVGVPAIVGSMADYARQFGSIQNRKFDMGTSVAIAVQQGAQNFRCVRVTDGTDVAATIIILSTCLTLNALYTGTLGNSITAVFTLGSKASTTKLTINLPGQLSEVYDNIPGTANALWLAAAAAINSGNSALRGPSQLVSAVAGVGTTAVALNTVYTLATGTDGVATITAAVLVGVDTLPRKGMYALRSQGCSIGVLADADDSTQWVTQAGFGLSEGVYMILTAAAGIAIANGTTGVVDLKSTAGLDSYSAKLMHGDWLYWYDQTNAVIRLVSPQGFVAGRLGNLSPEQSSLNKQLYGVIGSQKSGVVGSGQQNVYTSADLTALFSVGIDVIANPQPGGKYWGVRLGHNSSSNSGTNGDNYTRMTNYIAATLNSAMGLYVGALITPALFKRVRTSILTFMAALWQQGMIGNPAGTQPYSAICDLTNNPAGRTSIGYLQCDVQVQLAPINEKFLVNLEDGQTVTIQRTTLPGGQV